MTPTSELVQQLTAQVQNLNALVAELAQRRIKVDMDIRTRTVADYENHVHFYAPRLRVEVWQSLSSHDD